VLTAMVAHSGPTLPGGLKIENLTPRAVAELPEATRALIASVYASGFHLVFMIGAAMAFGALICANLLRDERLPVHAKG